MSQAFSLPSDADAATSDLQASSFKMHESIRATTANRPSTRPDIRASTASIARTTPSSHHARRRAFGMMMATPAYLRSPWSLAKRFKVSRPERWASQARAISNTRPARMIESEGVVSGKLPDQPPPPISVAEAASVARSQSESADTPDDSGEGEEAEARMPRSVQALYLRPLKRRPQYGVPTCDLQLRSYSVRNLEFFADFALRAAYYLHMPASGPIPLPRITERWTVPRSNFVHKKSQENFERITLRRLIQIQDGHPDSVEIWLSFLQKHQYYGVGMKANVWEYEKLGVGKSMDASLENLKQVIEPKWGEFGEDVHPPSEEQSMEMPNGDVYKFRPGALGTRVPSIARHGMKP